MRLQPVFLSLLCVVFFTAGGCSISHVHSEKISPEFFPQKSAEDVVYRETIQEPHTVIGSVTVNTERNQKLDEILEKMKREAGIWGGDAVTDIQTDATGAWKKLPSQKFFGNAYIRANFTAKIVVFK